jgi:isocitrate dehydrogenase
MAYRTTNDGFKRVTILPGDGIGPEVMAATVRVVNATGVRIAWEERAAGAAVFRAGDPTGVPPETIASIRETRVVLKSPLETPVGFGEKSANVTLRKLFETFANIRPVREWPGVPTPFAGRGIDLVVVRENVEDLYAGIEHMQTPGVAQTLKLISQKGCEKVCRVAFEVARAEGRSSVTCVTKANIMKLSEGLLKRTFEAVAKEYPDIRAEHMLVDNAAHQLVRRPERFEVLVTTNMNGDILSDLTSGLIGGLGFAPGANVGREIAIFEAVHGTAPDIAGKDMANPTALLLSAAMMLRHLEEPEAARRIEDSVAVTLSEGGHTCDVPGTALSTTAFADRVIANLGRSLPGHTARAAKPIRIPVVDSRPDTVVPASRRTAGVDVFVEAATDPETLGKSLEAVADGLSVRLKMISNRGARVYPSAGGETDCVDHWRCRFVARGTEAVDDATIIALMGRVGSKWRWMHIEKLEEIDGTPGWTRAQGEEK